VVNLEFLFKIKWISNEKINENINVIRNEIELKLKAIARKKRQSPKAKVSLIGFFSFNLE